MNKAWWWERESRYKFIELSQHARLYISYNWRDFGCYINLENSGKKKAVLEVKLDKDGNIRYIKSFDKDVIVEGER